MTAHATIEERQRCVAAGMNDHVAKPIDPAALYAALRPYAGTRASERPATVRTPAESGEAGVPAVEGLDIAQGLRRVVGNRALYFRLLRQFLEGHADAAERIRESLVRGDRALAERLAHTVNGTAGNLAAGPVQAAAGALEKAIREGLATASAEKGTARLGEALASLATALRPVLADVTSAADVVRAADAEVINAPVPSGVLKEATERWSRLLTECDAASIDDLERDRPFLKALFGGAEALARFGKLVQAYDFEDALQALRRAAAERGI
jgi:two-component system sensor histidine kinase/response regulator